MEKEYKNIKIKERIKIHEPELYDVVMLNDDITTMDFVVKILVEVFFHPLDKAKRLMLRIHLEGETIVGTFTLDIARSKTRKTILLAQQAGFPLQLKTQKHQ